MSDTEYTEVVEITEPLTRPRNEAGTRPVRGQTNRFLLNICYYIVLFILYYIHIVIFILHFLHCNIYIVLVILYYLYVTIYIVLFILLVLHYLYCSTCTSLFIVYFIYCTIFIVINIKSSALQFINRLIFKNFLKNTGRTFYNKYIRITSLFKGTKFLPQTQIF